MEIEFEETIKEHCAQRQDKWAVLVESRILAVFDLPAADDISPPTVTKIVGQENKSLPASSRGSSNIKTKACTEKWCIQKYHILAKALIYSYPLLTWRQVTLHMCALHLSICRIMPEGIVWHRLDCIHDHITISWKSTASDRLSIWWLPHWNEFPGHNWKLNGWNWIERDHVLMVVWISYVRKDSSMKCASPYSGGQCS